MVSPEPGDPLTWEEVTACKSSPVALFHSLACFTTSIPDLFTLQDCFFDDLRVHQQLQITMDRQRPPTALSVNAWATTMQYLSDKVPYSPENLGSLVRETGCWTQFGSSCTLSAQNPVSSFARSSSSQCVQTPNDKDLKKEVAPEAVHVIITVRT